ncbi:glycoside hydrolase [Thermomonas sp. S9]|uniref:sialidase family protein n=1 Tax=Thermomonas sp. S9 TaxID=2885203 RepID=UPI00216AEF4E|nr:sialidase family protein [Thermomonas sp. S9]MCR6495185.1 glycoside hydrolase [Thermomonas sp. S9]
MRLPAFTFAAFALLLSACQRTSAPPRPANGDYAVQTWVLPAEAGSMAPALVAGPGGRVLLGWINRREGRRNALQFASYTEADGWQSQPRTIAIGNALQANAADPPHLLATPDGALWAQWVQTQPDAAGGTDVVLARSKDGGMAWEQITRVNTDGMPTEHGFAALWADGSDGAGVAWLDGRGKRPAPPHGAATGAHDEGEGDMQLRANRFTLDLARGSDAVVDVRSCDCCQVAVALTRRGPLLAWRDRDANEVRDIATARYQQGAWTAPRIAHADGWKVEGCPVNGPALAAHDANVALAWYSEGSGQPAVYLARSQDAGDQFDPPVTVAAGPNVLGRPAVALDARQVWVAWLEQADRGQRLQLARYAPDLSRRLQTLTLATLATRGLASGYPRLVVDEGGAWLAWTDVDASGVAHLKGARVAR